MAPTSSQSSRRKAAAKSSSSGAAPHVVLSQGSAATSTAASSSHEELRAKLTKSADLEAKLQAMAAQSTPSSAAAAKVEEKASRLRMDICEILSDVLLADPNFAMRKDVSGRLWRSCFYGRIGELRTRTGKERGRMKRYMTKGDKDGADRHRRVVEDLEKSLKTFIGEALTLYDYLVDKYQRMLMPPSCLTQSQSQSPSMSQQSQASIYSQDAAERQQGGGRGTKRELYQPGAAGSKRKHPPTPTLTPPAEEKDQASHEVSPGVIPTLYKLLLNLGDLQRYGNKHSQAEATYRKASKLAPGKGNPYNQLAVVAQLAEGDSPLTGVALYWYARSLLAIDEPFVTSRANLGRLFLINRQWLEKNGGDEEADILTPPAENNVRGRKAQLERARAIKSAASRKFLARFVDLHWDLFRRADLAVPVPPLPSPDETIAAMESIVESFSSLLAGAAFGDALLVKLVCVNAFAACDRLEHDGDGGDKAPSASEAEAATSRTVAAGFTLSFGAALARHLGGTLTKLDQGTHRDRAAAAGGGGGMGRSGNGQPVMLKKPQNIPGVRLLSPFVVLCDLVSSFYGSTGGGDVMALPPSLRTGEGGDSGGADSNAVIAFFSKAQESFWTEIAKVANLIRGSSALSGIVKSAETRGGSVRQGAPLPKEYEDLRGYLPFGMLFLSSGGSATTDDAGKAKSNSYIRAEAAIKALDLVPSSSSQTDSGKVSSNSEDDLKARISRFLVFVDRHGSESGSGAGRFFKTDRGSGEISCVLDDGGAGSTVDKTENDVSIGAVDFDAEVSSTQVKQQATTSTAAEVRETADEQAQMKKQATIRTVAEVREAADEEADDLLVYKKGAGAGPALLVPSSLLLSSASAKSAAKATEYNHKGGATDESGILPTDAGTGDTASSGLLKPFSLSAPESEVTARASGKSARGSVGGQPIPQSLLPQSHPQENQQQARPIVPPPGFMSFAPMAQSAAQAKVNLPSAYATPVGAPTLAPPGFQTAIGVQQQLSGEQLPSVNQSLGGYYDSNTLNPFVANPLPNQQIVQQRGASEYSVGERNALGDYTASGSVEASGILGTAQSRGAADINPSALPGFGSLVLENDNVFDLKALGIDGILNGSESESTQNGEAAERQTDAFGQVGPAYVSPFGNDGLRGMPATRNPFAS